MTGDWLDTMTAKTGESQCHLASRRATDQVLILLELSLLSFLSSRPIRLVSAFSISDSEVPGPLGVGARSGSLLLAREQVGEYTAACGLPTC